MNISTSQINQTTSDAVLATDSTRNNKKLVYVHTPDSVWTNIKYLLGMLAALVIPPLIPGVTSRELIMGYVGIVLGIYFAAFIYKLLMTYRPVKTRKERVR